MGLLISIGNDWLIIGKYFNVLMEYNIGVILESFNERKLQLIQFLEYDSKYTIAIWLHHIFPPLILGDPSEYSLLLLPLTKVQEWHEIKIQAQ